MPLIRICIYCVHYHLLFFLILNYSLVGDCYNAGFRLECLQNLWHLCLVLIANYDADAHAPVMLGPTALEWEVETT